MRFIVVTNDTPEHCVSPFDGDAYLKKSQDIFVNNQLDAQLFFMYVYFYSLHVWGSHVPIIRRINCINTTSGMRYVALYE
jgi:hypothetical protein